MKHLHEYILEKLSVDDNDIITNHIYTKQDFLDICDFKSLIDDRYDACHVNFYLGNVLSKQNNEEKLFCGWSFIEYWDEENGGTGDKSEFFYIINEEQFNFLDETHVLRKNKTNGGYKAPEFLIDILINLAIGDVFYDDFDTYIISVDDFCNNPIIKQCWNKKIETNINDLKRKI